MLKEYLKKILIVFSITFILLFASGLIITIIYGDNIKQYFISKINNYLSTEIKVGEVDFSLLKKFPDACINFHDVIAMSAPGYDKKSFKNINSDTLLVAKEVYLQFNIFDIFSGKYNIKAIHIADSHSTILIDNNGDDNYHFWKSPESSDTSTFKLDLRDIRLTNFAVNFYDKAQNLTIKCSSTDFNISGKFNDEKYELKTNGNLKIIKFKIAQVNYIKSDAVSLKIKFDVDNNNLHIKDGKIKLNKLNFDVYGSYSYSDSKLNIQIKGKDIDVKSFISVLPENIQQKFQGFSSDGIFYFDTKIIGTIS